MAIGAVPGGIRERRAKNAHRCAVALKNSRGSFAEYSTLRIEGVEAPHGRVCFPPGRMAERGGASPWVGPGSLAESRQARGARDLPRGAGEPVGGMLTQHPQLQRHRIKEKRHHCGLNEDPVAARGL